MGQNVSRCEKPTRVVLVGGGHGNIQIIKYLSNAFLIEENGFHLIMISDQQTAFYSGMLPGSISSMYKTEDIQINLKDLCKWCGAELIEDKMISINWESKEIICERNWIKFDYTVINIGSETQASDLPGVMQYAILTRPISELLIKIENKDKELESLKEDIRNVVVVGSGAAGLELAWAFRARLEKMNKKPKISIVHNKKGRIFDPYPNIVIQKIEEKLLQHNITIIRGQAVEITEKHLILSNERKIPYDYIIWATGAKAPSICNELGVELSDDNYIQVNKYLQSVSNPYLFAVGDCCNFIDKPVAKAGVYSVREGPIAAENIKNIILGKSLVEYKPQDDFLSLLNTSDGDAISCWKRTSFTGTWTMKLKDKIDRKFMDSFKPELLGQPPQLAHKSQINEL